MDNLIEQLQNTKTYTVTEIGGEGEKVNTISNYRAINSKTHEKDAVQEVSSADLVSCNSPRQRREATTNAVLGYLRCWPKHPQIHCSCHCQSNRLSYCYYTNRRHCLREHDWGYRQTRRVHQGP